MLEEEAQNGELWKKSPKNDGVTKTQTQKFEQDTMRIRPEWRMIDVKNIWPLISS